MTAATIDPAALPAIPLADTAGMYDVFAGEAVLYVASCHRREADHHSHEWVQ
jgi:hypothetical protein